MMLIGFIDLTYGANIGAVSNIVRKQCIDGSIQTRVSISRSIMTRADVSGMIQKRVDLDAIVQTDC